MSQSDPGNMESPLSGASFINDKFEPWRDALYSMHSGSSRPPYAVEGLCWRDTTTTPWIIKMFNGTDDIVMGWVDPTNLEFHPAGSLLYTAQTVGGTANAIELSDLKPFNFQLEDGALIFSLPPTPNTGPVTVDVAGTGPIAVKKILPTGYADMDPFDIGGIPSIIYYSAANGFYISFFTFYEGFGIERSTNTTAGFGNYKYREVATAAMEYTLPLSTSLTDYYFFHYHAAGGDITFTPDDASDSINDGAAGASFVAPQGSTGMVFSIPGSNQWWVTGSINEGHGQCKLVLDGTDLRLNPHNGNKLKINGISRIVPSAGVALAPTSLAASTLYYIYAYMNSGTMTLEASTTAYATDANTGVKIKTGDATRTLVGMARTTGAVAWANSATQLFLRSFFNDPGYKGKNTFTANRTTTSTSLAELNSEIRIEFLAWADEVGEAAYDGGSHKDTSSGSFNIAIGLDGATALEGALVRGQSNTANVWNPIGMDVPFSGASEGYHYITILGMAVGAGTVTALGGAAGACSTLLLKLKR